MTKTYFTPMLSIVSISKNDIIATSLGSLHEDIGYGEYAPDRNSWDAGY